MRVTAPTGVEPVSGKIAVVVDKSAFEMEGGQLADLALQIFRDDGLLQVVVAMDHTLIRK